MDDFPGQTDEPIPTLPVILPVIAAIVAIIVAVLAAIVVFFLWRRRSNVSLADTLNII